MIKLLLPLVLLSMQTYPQKFEDCTSSDSRNVCLYVDVATPLTINTTDGFPARIQYLPRVRVTYIDNSWFTSNQVKTTDSNGRVVFMVRAGSKVTLRTDSSDIVVGLLDANGAPVPHHYIDKNHTWINSGKNERFMFVLKIAP